MHRPAPISRVATLLARITHDWADPAVIDDICGSACARPATPRTPTAEELRHGKPSAGDWPSSPPRSIGRHPTRRTNLGDSVTLIAPIVLLAGTVTIGIILTNGTLRDGSRPAVINPAACHDSAPLHRPAGNPIPPAFLFIRRHDEPFAPPRASFSPMTVRTEWLYDSTSGSAPVAQRCTLIGHGAIEQYEGYALLGDTNRGLLPPAVTLPASARQVAALHKPCGKTIVASHSPWGPNKCVHSERL
jgi:hypothetical protein